MAEVGREGDAADLLLRELTEARGHLAATSEVLAVLGRSGSDVDAILGAVVDGARQLCEADTGVIYLLDGDVYRVARASGISRKAYDYIEQHPFVLDAGTLTGRVGLSRRPGRIDDVLRDASYGRADAQKVAGFRSTMAAPLLLDDEVLGVLNLWRNRVHPFNERDLTLVTAFAAHAAVAIRNVHLVQTLERRSAELEVASQHKSEFLASMSHELRTPLNAVIGFSEVLLQRMAGDLNERQEEYLRDILGSGRHLLELLNDILDLSKVEAGAMELEPSWFEVGDAVDYALAMVRERAARQNLRLSTTIPGTFGSVYADELRIKQVLLNLLANAVKFTDDSGEVQVSAARDGEEIVVEITDSGVGIAADDQDRIFDSFQQGTRSARRHEGTGLGLTLCKRIVELHGGSIWVQSSLGAGSTFGFRLPSRALRDDGAAVDERDDAASPLVLLVDDDESSLSLLQAYLDSAPYETSVVRDGVDALELVRTLRPAAVVLDIRLPGLIGWDVLAAIKADSSTAATPVVVASVVDDRARGMSLGAAAYLIKPVSRDDVLGALAGVLGETSASAGSASSADTIQEP